MRSSRFFGSGGVSCDDVADALPGIVDGLEVAEIEVQQHGSWLSVSVSDNGAGRAEIHSGSGLRGLADRVEALGGSLTIVSPPSAGTSLRAEIPVSVP